MIITTSNETEVLIEKALRLSEKYGIEYRARGEKSLAYLFETADPQVFVVNHNRGLSYYEEGKAEAFYHPNMAFHRIHTLQKGGSDTLASVCGLEKGMTFLDCTLGLASDALTAAYVVGETGRVTGVEKSLPIYILLREGMEFYAEQAEQDTEMRTVIERLHPNIHHSDNLTFLRSCGDKICDVLYFDFMFRRPVHKSFGIEVIRNHASYDTITDEHLTEAIRVAGERVVVKTDLAGMRELVEREFVCLKENSRKNFYYMAYRKGNK